MHIRTNLLLSAKKIQAQVYTGTGIPDGINEANPLDTNVTIIEVILRVVNVVLSIIGLIALAAIIIAGIYLIVGGVSDDNRQKARDIIIYVIIGLLVIIFAKVLISFVIQSFIS